MVDYTIHVIEFVTIMHDDYISCNYQTTITQLPIVIGRFMSMSEGRHGSQVNSAVCHKLDHFNFSLCSARSMYYVHVSAIPHGQRKEVI